VPLVDGAPFLDLLKNSVKGRVEHSVIGTQEAAVLRSAFLNHENCDNPTPGGRQDSQ
jgi:hypothetical protein